MKVIDNFEINVEYDKFDVSVESEDIDFNNVDDFAGIEGIADGMKNAKEKAIKFIKWIISQITKRFSKYEKARRLINKFKSDLKSSDIGTEASSSKSTIYLKIDRLYKIYKYVKSLDPTIKEIEKFVNSYNPNDETYDESIITKLIDNLQNNYKLSDDSSSKDSYKTNVNMQELYRCADASLAAVALMESYDNKLKNAYTKFLTKCDSKDDGTKTVWFSAVSHLCGVYSKLINKSIDEVIKIYAESGYSLRKLAGSLESQIIEAVMEEYGIEGVASIIRNISNK